MPYNHEEELKKATEAIEAKNKTIGETETEVDSEEARLKNKLVQVIKLTDGREITFDFGKLTGRKILEIKREYNKLKKKEAAMIEELDDFYYILVASFVTGYPTTFFTDLPYIDYNRVKNRTRDFLGED